MANLLNSPFLLTKGIGINDLPPEAWRIIRGTAPATDVRSVFSAVPWFFRGVHLRANAVSKMPFIIEKENGTEVDNSNEYKNAVGWLPNPRRLLYRYEMSLTVEGAAYAERVGGAFTGGLKELRYLVPLSMRPHVDDTGNIDYFERMVRGGGLPIILQPDEVLYTFLLDPYVETGVGTSPGRAALRAGSVLVNEDEFVANFFAHGAVKATVLTMEGGDADPSEKDRLLSWWQRVANGVKGAFASHIVNAKVKPEVIGEGIEALANQTLTREKREDVATAFGIPHTLLFSDAANYATAQQDDKHFYDKTIVQECDLIADDMNEQVFRPEGLRLRFLPEALDVFQTDENERSLAYKNYVDTGMRPSVAVQILGIDLPPGVTPETLDGDWEKKQNQALEIAQARTDAMQQNRDAMSGKQPPASQQPPEQKPAKPAKKSNTWLAVADDLDRWQRKVLKAYKAGKPLPDFTSEVIPAGLAFAVRGALETVTDTEAVKSIFDSALEWEDYA